MIMLMKELKLLEVVDGVAKFELVSGMKYRRFSAIKIDRKKYKVNMPTYNILEIDESVLELGEFVGLLYDSDSGRFTLKAHYKN